MKWLVGIASFFLVVFSVNGLLAYYAFTTGSDLYEESPYERGLEYEEVILRKKAAVASGLTPQIFIEDENEMGSSLVRVSLLNDQGQAVAAASVLLRGKYAASGDEDFSVALSEVTPGVFAANIAMRGKGIWFLDVEVSREEIDENTMLWQERFVRS